MDNCQVCYGENGGAAGNENRVDDIVMCDYCHSEYLQTGKVGVKCAVCKRTMLVSTAQKKLMDQIGATTCGPLCAMKWLKL